MTRPARALDRWLFAPGTAHATAAIRAGLAAAIALRVALGPYAPLGGQPAALFDPPPFLAWLPAMPGTPILVAVQVVGAVAAVLAVAQRRPALTFPVAWTALLVLAGLRGSLGKILHNDVLLLLASIPFLAAAADARLGDRRLSARNGWAPRAAIVVVAGAYFAAGVEKLVHSGAAWVTSDNMRWILYQAAGGGRVRTPEVALFVADRPWLAHALAATLLASELAAPLIVFVRRFRPVFIALAAALHLGTWLTLGLDYWAWALTVAVVLWDWDGTAAGAAPRASPQLLPASTSTS